LNSGSNKKLIFISIVTILLTLGYWYFFYEGFSTHKQQLSNFSLNKPLLYSKQAIIPIPLENTFDKNKIILGKKLFNEPLLSKNNSVACASCHSLFTAGVDRLPVSIGLNGAMGERNAPTVFNSRYNFRQFWDGRAASLEEQVSGPIHNPVEMDSNWLDIITKLKANKDYLKLFTQIYNDGITANNITNAIAEFERSLTTPNSIFDQYLRGNKKALSEAALLGYQKFVDYGCISCHQGINLGGNMFQKLGVIENYYTRQNETKNNLGRYNITKLNEDKHIFKVPSLRNVAVTPPYFHDGSITRLSEVIDAMGYYQLGKALTDEDIKHLQSFLESLTGEWQGSKLK